jgi:hypothetical protein
VRRELSLLTDKPVLFAANVAEDELAAGNAASAAVMAFAEARGDATVLVSARVEAELAELDQAERDEYLESLGVRSSGLERLIASAYRLLGLITFLTVGPTEARAWTIRDGATAPEAAGTIHSDFERGFIKAEVISYDDYVAGRRRPVRARPGASASRAASTASSTATSSTSATTSDAGDGPQPRRSSRSMRASSASARTLLRDRSRSATGVDARRWTRPAAASIRTSTSVGTRIHTERTTAWTDTSSRSRTRSLGTRSRAASTARIATSGAASNASGSMRRRGSVRGACVDTHEPDPQGGSGRGAVTGPRRRDPR